MTSGVSQGLILAPILFNIYMKDFGTRTRYACIEFVNDTKLEGTGNMEEDQTIILHKVI